MAKIKIEYTAPEAVDAPEVAPICPVFDPCCGYAHNECFEGTPYEYSTGFGTWEGYDEFLKTVTSHPGIVAMYKAAKDSGEAVEFEETDPMKVQFYKEVAVAYEPFGFTTTFDGEE